MPLVAYRNPQHYICCYNTEGEVDGAGNKRVMQRRMVLRPGLNEVDDEVWERAKTHPGLRRRIQQGVVELISDGDDAEHAAELTGMRVRESLTLVKETIDEDILRHWLEIEDRDSVVKALETQLSKVSKTQDQAEAAADKKPARRSRRKKQPAPQETEEA